jgi:hypothetical protein
MTCVAIMMMMDDDAMIARQMSFFPEGLAEVCGQTLGSFVASSLGFSVILRTLLRAAS